MQSSHSFLPTGYHKVAPGHLASVVTCLEMTARPRPRPARPLSRPMTLDRIEQPDSADYRALFRRIGAQYLWFSRLVMPDAELAAILADPAVEVYFLREHRRDIGLLELDFRTKGQCELAFFGLVPEAIGAGAGRFLMERALALAWAKPIDRLWVHTCTFDHPSAVGFYMRSGFRPYAVEIEIAPDPRLSGHLPRDTAPHIPIIE
jgi:GNAT superfamily N-acetyltransferase